MADSVPTDRDRSGGVVVDPSHQMPEELSFRALAGIPAWLTAGLTIIAIALVINQLLNLQLLVGVTILENQYLTLLAAAFLPIAFLSYPARPVRMGDAVPWYDWALAAIAFAICGYLTWTGKLSLNEGWEYAAPDHAKWLSVVLWLVVIEALRRTGGWPIAIIVFLVSLYPTVAEAMPVGIRGKGLAFLDAMAFHMFSVESVFGIPMRAFGQIVVGFIVFGVALNHTGGGKFFNDLALAPPR